MCGFEPTDARVIERRNIAVLARRKAVQPGLARVHDQRSNAGALDRAGERFERLLRILIVDADATLDAHGQLDRSCRGRDAVADESRLSHQASAEAALLHAIGRTADVEVYLVIPEVLGNARALRKLPRITAARLQRDRMLGGIVCQEP